MDRTVRDRQQWWRRIMAWLGQHELAVLVMLALAAGGIWAFAILAEEVIEGETHVIDQMVLLAMRNPADSSDPLGPAWLEETVRDFTALGSTGVLIFITLSVAGFLVQRREYRMTWLVLMAVGGGMLLTTLLKQGFDRPRPDLVPHGSFVTAASFPSGHAMVSAATYLTLGALLARTQSRRRLKAYLLLLATLLTLAVGASRVYLGVHWPTDVLAGWVAGAVWAIISWLVARWLQQRGVVEEKAIP